MIAKIISTLLPVAVKFGVSQSQKPKFLALHLIAGFLFSLAALFIFIALHQFLSQHFQTPLPNLIFASIFILFGLVVLFIVRQKQQKQNHRNSSLLPIPDALQQVVHQGHQTITHASQSVNQFTQQHKGKLLLGAAVAGLILGSRTRGKRRQSKEG